MSAAPALAGRVAVVTGASRGIGAAVAVALAREGVHPVLVARTVGGLEETDDAIRAAGGAATLVPFDLTEFDKIDELAAAVRDRFGRCDALVGCAATLGMLGPMAHCDFKQWQQVLDLNLTANWRLIRAFDPALRAAPAGRAVFATCAAGHDVTAYWNAYAVSKAALEMMARTWQAELGLSRVKVTLIDPGPVATRLRKAGFPGEDQTALPRPEQVAGRFVEAVS